jgi:hypothetical protein
LLCESVWLWNFQHFFYYGRIKGVPLLPPLSEKGAIYILSAAFVTPVSEQNSLFEFFPIGYFDVSFSSSEFCENLPS